MECKKYNISVKNQIIFKFIPYKNENNNEL